jgi:hypothetical protein
MCELKEVKLIEAVSRNRLPGTWGRREDNVEIR